MQNRYDKIICKGLKFECELGFHEVEKYQKQTISIDFEVSVLPPKDFNDQVSSIQIDYFKASEKIGALLHQQRFNLIETTAEAISLLLLESFQINDVLVRVTKYPVTMPHLDSVSYECYRKR